MLIDKKFLKSTLSQMRTYFAEWRAKFDWSQEDVADKVDVSRNYLSRLETGSQRYNGDHLTAIANAFGCQPWQLFFHPNKFNGTDQILAIWAHMSPAAPCPMAAILAANSQKKALRYMSDFA